MSGAILQAVQQALYGKLTGDSALTDLVNGVYDVVPQQTALPYIVIGDGSASLLAQAQETTSQCQMSLNVWTGGNGRKQALAILNRLHALLHHGALNFTGFTLLSMSASRAETQVDVDQDRIYGTLELSITVREDS